MIGDNFQGLANQIIGWNNPNFTAEMKQQQQLEMMRMAQQTRQNQQQNQLEQMRQAQTQQYQQAMIKDEQERISLEKMDKKFSQNSQLRKAFDDDLTPPQVLATKASYAGIVDPNLLDQLAQGRIADLQAAGWEKQTGKPLPILPNPAFAMPNLGSGIGPANTMPGIQQPLQPGQLAPGETKWVPPTNYKYIGSPNEGITAISERPGQIGTATTIQEPNSFGTGPLKQQIEAQRIISNADSGKYDKATVQGAQNFLKKQEGGTFLYINQLATDPKYNVQDKDPSLSPEQNNKKNLEASALKLRDYLTKNDPGTLAYFNAIKDGKVPISGFSEKANEIRDAVFHLFPNADLTQLTVRQNFQAAAGNPGSIWRQNLTSLNTVAEHLSSLDQTIEDLKLGPQPIGNVLTLMARQITGDPTITAESTDRMAVILETHRALSGVGITDQEMKNAAKNLPSKMVSYDQAKQFVKSLAQLVNQRMGVQQETANSIMGEDNSTVVEMPGSYNALKTILGVPNFNTESLAKQAADRGLIRSGDRINIGGVSGVWQ